jgi:hypothetical protein
MRLGKIKGLWACALCAAAIACSGPTATPPGPATPPQTATPALSDGDGDGMPDALELVTESDRANFRAWFTMIAEQQFYEPSKVWNTEQRDCAGLARFAWREALRTHDRAWFQKMGASYSSVAPDVKAYTLEKNVLGEKLFRARGGAFTPVDLENGAFNEFADAKTLKEFNANFISRDVRQARPGDLLFYFQAFSQKQPYHVMIFLGAARQDGQNADDWVVYHTGGAPEEGGEVRKTRLSALAKHPNRRWRPVAENKNFLGFYRLKILQ